MHLKKLKLTASFMLPRALMTTISLKSVLSEPCQILADGIKTLKSKEKKQ